MRIGFTQLLISILIVGIGYGHEARTQELLQNRITIDLGSSPIKTALREIEKKSGIKFLYRSNVLNTGRSVSLNAKNEVLASVLDRLLLPLGVGYEVSEKHIILKRIQNASGSFNLNDLGSPDEFPDRMLSGQVKDETGSPLPGVSVLIKGTQSGTVTDGGGHFSLNIANDEAILVLSFVGYLTQEISVGKRSSLDISMAADQKTLEELVVVGYGTQKKVNMTGAVSNIDARAIENRAVTNLSSALVGLSSGMYVRQTSGRPGDDGATIRIRGTGTLNSNTALVIIDGIQGVLDAVNPDDVESISVLKDAAAASIYGSLAANGVILVTTKKGAKGKMSVSYTGMLSQTTPSRLPTFVTNYARHMRLTNEGFTNLGQTGAYYQTTIDAWEAASQNPNGLTSSGVPNYIAYPNTNWTDVIFENKTLQNHNISVTAGTDKTQYLLSVGYLYNPGVMANTQQERYQMRVNLQSKIADFLTIGTQTFAQTRSEGMGSSSNAFTYLYATTPGVYPYWNGKYGFPEAAEESSTANNIQAYLYNIGGSDIESRFNTTLFANVDLFRGLTFETKVNYQIRWAENNSHNNPFEKWSFATNTLKQAAELPGNMTTYYAFNKNSQITLDNVLRYSTTIASKHDVGILLGYNQYYYKYYNFNTTKQGLLDASITTLNSANTVLSASGDEYDYSMRSYFGRINYSYKDRYLLEGVLRYDGSSRFSSSNRWGWFPAFSAGWRVSEEAFMSNASRYVQNLKIRGSWGSTGNNSAGNYDYQSAYSTTNYSFNGATSTGLASTKAANPNLRWETTTTTNVGVEGGLLKNALTFEFDWYRKYTDGILYTPTIPLTTGTASAATQNIAEVLNRGIELTLGFRGNKGAFNYRVSGNFAYNYNRVTKYRGTLEEGWTTGSDGSRTYSTNLGDVSTGSDTRVLEGHTISEHYLYDLYKGDGTYFNGSGEVNIAGGPKDGMIRTPEDLEWVRAMMAAGYRFQPGASVSKSAIYYGDFIYADTNGDGNYGNTFDKSFTNKSATPKYNFGLQANFEYKGFDMSMVWSGSTGMWYYWGSRGYLGSTVQLGYAISETVANDHYYYNEADPADINNNIYGKYPRLKNTTDAQNSLSSTFYLHNASYFKLKNLQIGYTLPKQLSRKAFVEKARLYVSGENLFMITKYPILDPEVGAGITYPTMRQFSLGVNLTF